MSVEVAGKGDSSSFGEEYKVDPELAGEGIHHKVDGKLSPAKGDLTAHRLW